MLLTMTLTEFETARWSSDARLRADLKLLASKQSRARNRRFFQVQGADGQVLAVGESLAVTVPYRISSAA